MAFTRPGQQAAPAPAMQAQAFHTPQTATRTSGTLMPSSAVSPTEIITMDGQHLTVSFEDVRNVICPKATDAECKIFLETCRQYKLNPFTKEAYLIHYDNNSDATASSIVLGKACYMQMAERHPQYDGFEAGVIVMANGQLFNREGAVVYEGEELLGGWAKVYRKDRSRPSYSEVKFSEYDVMANGQLFNREGAVVYEGEELLGGWAKVYRKDRSRPSYSEVKFSEYDTGKSLWKAKPATMIRKVALVQALREAFPTTFGTLYDESEISIHVDAEGEARELDDEPPYRRRSLRSRKEPAPAALISTTPETEPTEAEDVEGDPFGGDGL